MADPYEWASPNTLVEQGYPEDVAQRAVFSASWLLWALSGRSLHSEGNRVDTWELRPGGRLKISLRYRPVLSITSVTTTSPWTAETASCAYTLVGNQIHLTATSLSPVAANIPVGGTPVWATPANLGPIDAGGRPVVATVKYRVGSNLPPQTHLTVLRLAEEYCKAATNKPCNLPERVTSVTRGGMTWALLDPADFLDKGMTGVLGIDGWLVAVNPTHARQPARVFDPAMPKLISSTWERVPTSQVTNPNGTVTFYGHGSPEVVTVPTAESGDSYVDLDTGRTYGAA